MNILTKIRLLNDINEKELRLGIASTKASWHHQYRESAWVYIGGLPYELSEGDVICVMSQYGEVVNINLIRDKKTGKSKGFAFLCYQDQRSSVLAVDNLNGAKIKGRQFKVDHVLAYKVPKEDDEIDDLTKMIREEGVAPKAIHVESSDEDLMEVKQEIDTIDISSGDERKKKRKKQKKLKEKSKKKKYSKKANKEDESEDDERRSQKHKIKNTENEDSKKESRRERNRSTSRERNRSNREISPHKYKTKPDHNQHKRDLQRERNRSTSHERYRSNRHDTSPKKPERKRRSRSPERHNKHRRRSRSPDMTHKKSHKRHRSRS